MSTRKRNVYLFKENMYIQIYEIISKVLDRIEIKTVQSLQDLYESDRASRLEASSLINNL